MKKSIIALALAALTAISLSSCTGFGGTAATSSSKKDYTLNETVNFDDRELTATKVEKADSNNGVKPKDGMEFVLVTVKIKNNNQGDFYYNPLQFRMLASNGESKDAVITNDPSENELKPGKLETNGEVEGFIVFEEPKDDSGLVLCFTDSFMNKDPRFKIKLS